MDAFKQESPLDEAERISAYLSADAEVQAEMRTAAAGPAGSLATWEFIRGEYIQDSQISTKE